MNGRGNRGVVGVVVVVMMVAMIVGIAMANRWLREQTSNIESKPANVPPIVVPQKKAVASAKRRKGDVIRRTRFSPDRKYEINVFYQEGVEIARNRSSKKEGTYDQSGEIPDGKVKFINESDETYGVEYYRNQQLHGAAKIYYSDGALNKDIYYQYGKLMTSTEYYYDGAIRMEEDYTDARERLEDRDVGVGKVYFRNGQIKYEWRLVITERVGFEKSYDQKGRLTGAFYFDEYGQPIEQNKTGLSSEVPLGINTPANIGTPLDSKVSPVIERMPKQIFIPAS